MWLAIRLEDDAPSARAADNRGFNVYGWLQCWAFLLARKRALPHLGLKPLQVYGKGRHLELKSTGVYSTRNNEDLHGSLCRKAKRPEFGDPYKDRKSKIHGALTDAMQIDEPRQTISGTDRLLCIFLPCLHFSLQSTQSVEFHAIPRVMRNYTCRGAPKLQK